jgi:hypothetical protein
MRALVLIAALCMVAVGCSQEPTLQKYFVEKTESPEFIALDISPTIFNTGKISLTAEEKRALESFKKMNILAFKANDTNKAKFDAERMKVKELLKDEKYQMLMKFGKGKEGGSLSFVGDENHIEEFVLYASQSETGFAVVRILGEDMNPTGVMTIMSLLQKADVDLDQLKPLQAAMKN